MGKVKMKYMDSLEMFMVIFPKGENTNLCEIKTFTKEEETDAMAFYEKKEEEFSQKEYWWQNA